MALWRGPSAEMQRAHNDPLFTWIVRRCSIHGIQMNMELDGRRAVAFAIEQAGGRCGTYFKRDIPGGDVTGPDPWGTALHVALALTPFDTELMAQYGHYIDRLCAEIEQDLKTVLKIEYAVDDFLA